jgi:transcriptional regulator with XRE-family HTH domain
MSSKALSDLLRDLREDRGTSLRAAARDLGVDPSYLSRVERGSKSVSAAVLDRAARYYDVPREQFVTAAGDLPEDVLEILRANPGLVAQIRSEYGAS